MKASLSTAWRYVMEHRKKIILIALSVIIVIIALLALSIALRPKPAPKLAYQPVKACDLFTIDEAHTLLGKNVVGNVTDPTVSNDTAISKCSFSDLNVNQDAVTVAAVAVRSAVSNAGTKKNTDDFNKSEAQDGTTPISNLGTKAYFNSSLGQLNILDGRQWLIISYGQGTSPQANTLEKNTELANIVLNHLHQKK